MRYRKVSATVVALFLGMVLCGSLVSAHSEGEPMIVTVPADEGPIPCAVYFSDNMVYAPQWRMDNFVRIETMVINMTGYSSAEEVCTTDLDIYPTGLEQQAAMLADPTILNETRMVSVSYIEVSMWSGDEMVDLYESGWDPASRELVYVGEDGKSVGREVNKEGHLIYGMLWDTTGFAEGVYTVKVRLGHVEQVDSVWTPMLGEWYEARCAIANWYDPDAPDEGVPMDPTHPFHDLVLADDPLFESCKIGVGGLTDEVAWIELGPLMPRGPGGGSGGNGNAGDGGNGNGHCGENSNANAGSRSRGK